MSRRTSFGLISLKNSFPTMLFLGIAKRFPLFVIFSTHAVGDLPNLSEAKLTTMIERSIPYLEQKGVKWIEQKNCVSCHRIGNMIWSLSKAHQQGFKVSEQLDHWIKWSVYVLGSSRFASRIGNAKSIVYIAFCDKSAKQKKASTI